MSIKTVGQAAAVAIALVTNTPASATILTFEDTGGFQPNIPSGYGGLSWDSNFFFVDPLTYLGGALNPSGYLNGIVSGAYVGGVGVLGGSITSAQPFTFNSLYLTAAWNDGLTVLFTGKLNGVTVDTAAFVVDTSGPTLANFNWSNLDEVVITSFGGVPHLGYDGFGTQLAFDNVTINVAAVPELSTWAMLLAGFCALAGFGRLGRKNVLTKMAT